VRYCCSAGKNREQDISCRTKENVLGEGAVSIDDGEQPRCQLMGPPELRRNRPRAPLPLHHRGMQDISRDSDARVGLPYRDAEEDSWGDYGDSLFPSGGEDGREALFLRRVRCLGQVLVVLCDELHLASLVRLQVEERIVRRLLVLERAVGAPDRAAALKKMEAFIAMDCTLDAETL
jgi:hypothetical protein